MCLIFNLHCIGWNAAFTRGKSELDSWFTIQKSRGAAATQEWSYSQLKWCWVVMLVNMKCWPFSTYKTVESWCKMVLLSPLAAFWKSEVEVNGKNRVMLKTTFIPPLFYLDDVAVPISYFIYIHTLSQLNDSRITIY